MQRWPRSGRARGTARPASCWSSRRGAALVGGHAVGPREHAQRDLGDDDAVRADVGALVMPDLVAQPQQRAVGVERDLEAVALLSRVVDGDEVLRAVLDPLDRASERRASYGTRKSSGKNSPRTPKLPPASVLRSVMRARPSRAARRARGGCSAGPWSRPRSSAGRAPRRGRRPGRGSRAGRRCGGRPRARSRRHGRRRPNAAATSPKPCASVTASLPRRRGAPGRRLDARVASRTTSSGSSPGRQAPPRPRPRRGRRRRRPRRARRRSERRRGRGRAGGRRRAARRRAEAERDPRHRVEVGGGQHGVDAGRARAPRPCRRRRAARARRRAHDAHPELPGRSTSSTKRPVPRSRRASSTRRTDRPTAVMARPPPPRRPRRRGRPRGSTGSPCSGRCSTPSPRGSRRRSGPGSRAAARSRA